MKENKINFKLVNIALIVLIIVLLYTISGLWLGIIGKIWNILFPFVLGFAIAYALYPFVRKLQDNNFPKWLSIAIVCFITLGFLVLIGILVVPMLYDQILLFTNNITTFITDISSKYELNLGVLQTSVKDISSQIIGYVGKYISDGALNILNTSISIITNGIITLCVSIYFLMDMDKIRGFIKTKVREYDDKWYLYLRRIDREVGNYFSGLGKNIVIQFFEYTILFFLVGHPNYLILGILASVTTIIPYFGGLITNILALLIASVINVKLFILTLIICLVCPNIDGYIIGPKVYGKTNQLHPLVIFLQCLQEVL